ncbi:RNA degradosome polyphosphate kinase [Microbacterium ulmi]|uniref:Polyphosphate kinase n=1 Tax=Microbacterium ulmi TaxID=179095 RepID=A0A7Y2LY46_9MICO|nr:RNA degradosome polyphosphate kinase [Microbacterium ulmi]NII68525.1 polyphosphate kinase [Microbacterium ulmi]NNH02954.1 RNA degradosome polyphosphate kinase [Microbacterium ulmi]
MIEHEVLDAGLGDADDDDFDLSEIFDSQLPDNRYLDREVSWLAFNRRVLELAEDATLPLLERSNFLAIFASNLDEFFMVRVAGLKRRILTGLAVPTNVGRSPQEVLTDIADLAHSLQARHADVWTHEVKPALAEVGIEIVSWESLSHEERDRLYEYFQAHVFPVLMPLAVDPAHPFPYISGLSLNLAIRIRNAKTSRQEFARLKVPPMLPRFVRVSREGDAVRYLPLESLISNHLEDLFPGMEILDHHAFRLTRNEDVVVEEDETENLIQALEAELLRRRFGPPIRLEVTEDMDDLTLSLLIKELDITEQEVYRLPGLLDLRGLFDLSRIDRPELHYAPHVPTTALAFQPPEQNGRADIFAAIRKADVLVHHPYESFATSVQAFLEQAAKDPHVLAIKQTLYRTSGDSPIVQALIDAAEAGKQVLALVEVKARFDEAANIVWARKLEKAGVHVVYGLVGLKTHCKLALVIREEDGILRSYSHIGTGNYNPKTSRIYEDFGLFTVDEQVGRDLTRLFNELSGYAIEKKFKRLLVAPLHLRKGLLRLIDRERRNALAGRPARIRIKVNSMVDEQIIDALYRASQVGVPVEVWVRGICSLKPGVEGMSENITVRSILGRYLEHSRIFAFHNDGDPQVYIGSADMMHRNLDRRVEALVRVVAPAHLKELTDLFDLAMDDATSSWHLGPDGEWVRHSVGPEGTPLSDMQDRTMTNVQRRRRARAVR